MSPSAEPERFLEIFKSDRCPLCFLVRAYAHEHLKALLDECVTDPTTREKLFKSRGFCRRHAWQGVHQQQALGMAVIYRSLLEKGLEELSGKPTFWKFNKLHPCPICESEQKRDQSLAKEFARAWTESEKLRAEFREKGILCLPHLENVLSQKMTAPLKNDLQESGEKALQRLVKELDEFLEKQDYHRSHENLGGEWDAWIRAVRVISGERD